MYCKDCCKKQGKFIENTPSLMQPNEQGKLLDTEQHPLSCSPVAQDILVQGRDPEQTQRTDFKEGTSVLCLFLHPASSVLTFG